MAYNERYRASFCNTLGQLCQILIYRKTGDEPLYEYTMGENPIIITYRNFEDTKFNEITGSEVEISFISDDNISLKDFYSYDEREYLVKLFIDDVLKWSGWVLPDTASEPFLNYPYESRLKATDTLGTLKGVPFLECLGERLTGDVKVLDIVKTCLQKTGLSLDIIIGINIMPVIDTGSINNVFDGITVNIERFYNRDLPMSVYDVLKNILSQFTATLVQKNGQWWILNVDEIGTTNPAKQFLYYNDSIDLDILISNSVKEIAPDGDYILVNSDAIISFDKAYKSVSTFQKYSYPDDFFYNGKFNQVTGTGEEDEFLGWRNARLDNSEWYIGTKLDDQGLDSGDHFLSLNNFDGEKGFVSTRAFVDKNDDKIDISIDVQADGSQGIAPAIASLKAPNGVDIFSPQWVSEAGFIISLINNTDSNRYYWDGSKWVYTRVEKDFYVNFVTIDPSTPGLNENNDTFNAGGIYNTNASFQGNYETGATLNISLSAPPITGLLDIQIIGAGSNGVGPFGAVESFHTIFDNVSIKRSTNTGIIQKYGNLVTITQLKNFSFSPEPQLLMFGQKESEDVFSHGIEIADQVNVEAKLWYRYNKNLYVRSLQHLNTLTRLKQYQNTSQIFEGTIRALDVNILDSFTISCLEGKFFITSGVFDIKKSEYKILMYELFDDDPNDSSINILNRETTDDIISDPSGITPSSNQLFGNETTSVTISKNDCNINAVGGDVTYTVPACTYFAETEEEAIQLAQDDIDKNSQAFANKYGFCQDTFAFRGVNEYCVFEDGHLTGELTYQLLQQYRIDNDEDTAMIIDNDPESEYYIPPSQDNKCQDRKIIIINHTNAGFRLIEDSASININANEESITISYDETPVTDDGEVQLFLESSYNKSDFEGFTFQLFEFRDRTGATKTVSYDDYIISDSEETPTRFNFILQGDGGFGDTLIYQSMIIDTTVYYIGYDSSATCEFNSNGEKTGLKTFTRLRQYDGGEATEVEKPNDPSKFYYIAPYFDLDVCRPSITVQNETGATIILYPEGYAGNSTVTVTGVSLTVGTPLTVHNEGPNTGMAFLTFDIDDQTFIATKMRDASGNDIFTMSISLYVAGNSGVLADFSYDSPSEYININYNEIKQTYEFIADVQIDGLRYRRMMIFLDSENTNSRFVAMYNTSRVNFSSDSGDINSTDPVSYHPVDGLTNLGIYNTSADNSGYLKFEYYDDYEGQGTLLLLQDRLELDPEGFQTSFQLTLNVGGVDVKSIMIKNDVQ